MTYQEALAFIDELTIINYVPNHDNSVALMTYLGNPQNDMPVVHVAGTNGKGSTIAFCKHIWMAAGYNIGTFTSPHILSPLELVEINGSQMGEQMFTDAIATVKAACSKMVENGLNHPTVFECLTAASLLVLSKADLDIVLVEVGLGGRYDATNVFSHPLLTVVTNIDFDHTAILGRTLKEIAWHKGGIIKPGVPTVLAPNPIDVVEVISDIVRTTGHKLYLMDEGFIVEKILMTTGYSKLFHLKSNFFDYKALRTNMLGHHQTLNLATALLVVYQLRQTLSVTDNDIKKGVQNTHWPCRSEILSKRPLIMIDGGHNQGGANALKQMINTHFKDKEIITIVGMLKDKDTDAIMRVVTDFSQQLICTTPISQRAMDPVCLKDYSHTTIIPDYKEAIERALSLSNERTLILITGSLYLAQPARDYLLMRL